MQTILSRYRYLLADYDSVLAYSLLGIVGGIVSGLVILGFELLIVQLGAALGVGNSGEGFEALPEWLRFSLPAGGALLLGCVYAALRAEDRETGIVHVISRMHSHYSVLPLRNALLQFFAGAFALATGQSGGREGPGVHLGGAANSLLGQWFELPHNSLRVLIACGTAGGIAAAFQTPLAGAIFAMEVIVVEYTLVGFIPVMLAAVSAAAVSGLLSPEGVLFSLPELQRATLAELPLIMVLGLLCGLAVAAYIRLTALVATTLHWPVIVRFTLAGCFTGFVGMQVPEILGIGYDTLQLTLQGELLFFTLLTIALCKLLATAVCCGVGMPIGLIAPTLLIGASLGGMMGIVSAELHPDLAADPTLYIVLGMGAAMGAVLNAPLAALLAIMELTQTISISMGAMLAIVIATLTNSGLFRQRSAHQTLLHQLRRVVHEDPVNQLLHSSAVTATMDSRVVRVPAELDEDGFQTLLGSAPAWCLIERDGQDLYLVDGAELLEWIKTKGFSEETLDVTEADMRRLTTASVPMQASLRQALDAMRKETREAVCVYEHSARTGKPLLQGVVTRESIEKFSLRGLQ